MCLLASNKKKVRKKFLLSSLKSWRKKSDPELGPDPGIRIRIKMSRIPNTAYSVGRIRSPDAYKLQIITDTEGPKNFGSGSGTLIPEALSWSCCFCAGRMLLQILRRRGRPWKRKLASWRSFSLRSHIFYTWVASIFFIACAGNFEHLLGIETE